MELTEFFAQHITACTILLHLNICIQNIASMNLCPLPGLGQVLMQFIQMLLQFIQAFIVDNRFNKNHNRLYNLYCVLR